MGSTVSKSHGTEVKVKNILVLQLTPYNKKLVCRTKKKDAGSFVWMVSKKCIMKL